MSVRTWLGAAVAATAALLVVSGPALAVPSADIPEDVRAVLDGVALRTAPELTADGDPAVVRADDVHEVFRFSADFLRGKRGDVAVAPTGAWLAVLQHGEDVLGTVRVTQADGGEATLTGTDEDVDLGVALSELGDGELVVEEPKSGALFGLAGDTVRPLNTWARLDLTRPSRLSDLQGILTGPVTTDRPGPGLSREQWLRLVGWVGVGALGLAAMTVLVLRPRRATRPSRR